MKTAQWASWPLPTALEFILGWVVDATRTCCKLAAVVQMFIGKLSER